MWLGLQVPEHKRPFAAKQLLSGMFPLLKRAHRRGYVHHDLKLSNMMFMNLLQSLLGDSVPLIALIDWGFSGIIGKVPILAGGTLGYLSTDYLAGATTYSTADDM